MTVHDFYIFFVIQLLNWTLLILWVGLAAWALRRMGKYRLRMRTELLWTAAIVVIPIIGAITFLLQYGNVDQQRHMKDDEI